MNCCWKSFINLALSKFLLMLYLVDLNATSCTSPMRMLPWWKKWLMHTALQFSFHNCVDAAVTILRAGGCLAYIKCPHCSSGHLDGYPNSCCSTSRHLCSTCGKSWTLDSDVFRNPLAVFSPLLHDNRLLFAWTEGDGTLLSVVVEPSWLELVHEG